MKSRTMAKIFSLLLTNIFLFSAAATLPASAATAAVTQSPLYKKSAVFVGDSICYGAYDNSAHKAWGGRIGDKYEMTWYNDGISATAIHGGRTHGQIVSELSVHASKEIDYVIMQGGVNDAWDRVTVGTITEGYDPANFDNSTFAGGLENLFYTARRLYPNATYGFIINFTMPAANESYGTLRDMSAYFNIAKQICDKWKVPYLDLYNDTNFCQNVLKTHETTYMPDNIHPNAAGYELLAPKIASWMETLTRAEIPGVTIQNESPLYKKSVLFLGDEITAGTTYDDNHLYPTNNRGFGARIGRRNEMTYVNASEEGMSLSTVKEKRYIEKLNAQTATEFDYVIVHVGLGDILAQAPLGTVSASTSIGDFDESTYAGALEALLCRIKERYPDAIVGVVFPHQIPKYFLYPILNMQGFGSTTEKICQKWGASCLNLHADNDFCQNVLKVNENNLFIKEYIYPNHAGQDILSLKIESWMETLSRPSAPTEPEDTTAPETTAPVTQEKGGCRSTVSAFGSLTAVLTSLAGAALTLRRRKISDC